MMKLLICTLLTVLFMSVSLTQAVTQNGNSLPPANGAYKKFDAGYSSGIHLYDTVFGNFNNVARKTLGAHERHSFDSAFDTIIDFPSEGIVDVPMTLTGPVQMKIFDYTDGLTGTFVTEIINMSLSGLVDGKSVTLRESPSLHSTGQTTITNLGGGLWEIDSFFDIFTELSFDGGAFEAGTNGSANLTLMPEPSTIALLALGTLLIYKKRS